MFFSGCSVHSSTSLCFLHWPWIIISYTKKKKGKKNTTFSSLRPENICIFLRFHAQGDQSGPGLRRDDKQLRVWKGLLPKNEPWPTVTAGADRSSFTAATRRNYYRDGRDKVSSNHARIWFLCEQKKKRNFPTLSLQICCLDILNTDCDKT